MEESKVVKTLIDYDTGEIIELNEGDKLRIIRSKQTKAIEKSKQKKAIDEEIAYWNEQLGGFVFVLFKYCNNILNDYKEINQEDIVKLFYLATYVDYEGYIIYKKNNVDRRCLCEIVGIHVNNFDVFFNKMKKLNILIQDDNKYIKMSKDFFMKGGVENDMKKHNNYTRIYVNSIRYLYENVPRRSHGRLGNYFKIIPYIHRQGSKLCHNPNSKEEDIKLMYLKDLKTIFNCSLRSLRELKRNLLSVRLKDGSGIIAFLMEHPDELKAHVLINPKVFYGGNFDIDGGKQGIMKWFPVGNI